MPNRDQTGPQGLGSMTGRGLGMCGGGLRRGRGFGFGRRFGFAPVVLTEAEEKKILQAEAKELEAEKSEIEKRLKELK